MRIIWCPTGRDLWFDLALKMQKENLAEIVMWLAATLTSHVIPGTINPSNEKYLSSWYTNDTFRGAEFEGIFNTLKKVLLQEHVSNNQKQK